jgi:hypothetical protein
VHQHFWFRANHGVRTMINHANRLGHRFRPVMNFDKLLFVLILRSMLMRRLGIKFVKGLFKVQWLVFTPFFILSLAKDPMSVKAVSLFVH